MIYTTWPRVPSPRHNSPTFASNASAVSNTVPKNPYQLLTPSIKADLPAEGVLLADVPDTSATMAFNESYPRLVLPRWCSGLGVRPWALYYDAAYVGA